MAHFLSKEGVKMKRILIGGAMVMLIAGCGETELKKEDIVCVYTHPAFDKAFAQYVPSPESVFSCTNKAGEIANGVIKNEIIEGRTTKLYIKDGLITKWELDAPSGKEEMFFEKGKYVKYVNDKGKVDDSVKDSNMSMAELVKINKMISKLESKEAKE